MDPITIIGTAGSVANIIDTISKVIGKIREIHHQWKDADFALVNLVSQLTTLRAALTKIEEWMGSASPDEHYYQLKMDLDLSLACCSKLVESLNSQVSDLSTREDGSLGPTARIKMILGTSRLEELQKFIDRQTNALTLLLTACNCKSISEQKTHLERRRTREIMSNIEKDTESLLVHRDGDSSQSLSTDRGSQLSRTFTFDRQLWRSRVYEKVNKQLIKRTIRIQQSHQSKSSNETGLQGATSNNFGSENFIPGDHIQPLVGSNDLSVPATTNKRTILVLGARDAGKSTILKQVTILYQNGYSDRDRLLYCPAIFTNLAECAMDLVEAMDECNMQLKNPETWAMRAKIDGLRHITRRQLDESDLEPIAKLWADPDVRKVMNLQHSLQFQSSATYLLENASRITAPGYIPTGTDLLMFNAQTAGVSETSFTVGNLPIRMIDVGGSRSERRKWINAFKDVHAMLFIVDLASYDQSIPEHSDTNMIHESLAIFESLMRSTHFTKATVFLIFNKMDEFKLKFATSPLKNQFPDYIGGNDLEQGMQFLANCFTQLIEGRAPVTKYFIRAINGNDVRRMFKEIEETLVQNG